MTNLSDSAKKKRSISKDIPPLSDNLIDRFHSMYEKSNGCFLWNGNRDKKGYGIFFMKSEAYRAHRVSYLIKNGNISKDKVICHMCDTPSCVNPEHLFEGTHSDNIKDCVNKNRHHFSSRTHCSKGHKYTKETLRKVVRNNGWNMRTCLICKKEHNIKNTERIRGERIANLESQVQLLEDALKIISKVRNTDSKNGPWTIAKQALESLSQLRGGGNE